MTKTIQLHRLTAADGPRNKAIRLRALKDCPDAFGSTFEDEATQPDSWWSERLANPKTATFVAILNGQDIGLAVGAPYDEDAGLFAMWVAPEARGTGAADMLVKAVLDWARDRGCSKIKLDVGDWNKVAIRLYARHGFEPNGMTGTLAPPRDHITEHQRVLIL